MVKADVENGNSTTADRRESEIALFASAISRHINKKTKVVLEYGCGVGRLAKGILEKNKSIELIGISDSSQQMNSALAFVNDERFETLLPHELNRHVDLIYCMYILHHLPAIELRDTLHRMHHFLKPGGKIIIFATDARRAVRLDKPEFFDDRCLGVNLRNEIQRFFEPQSALLTEAELMEHPEMSPSNEASTASSTSSTWLTHPVLVYVRRELEGPAFNAPYRS